MTFGDYFGEGPDLSELAGILGETMQRTGMVHIGTVEGRQYMLHVQAADADYRYSLPLPKGAPRENIQLDIIDGELVISAEGLQHRTILPLDAESGAAVSMRLPDRPEGLGARTRRESPLLR